MHVAHNLHWRCASLWYCLSLVQPWHWLLYNCVQKYFHGAKVCILAWRRHFHWGKSSWNHRSKHKAKYPRLHFHGEKKLHWQTTIRWFHSISAPQIYFHMQYYENRCSCTLQRKLCIPLGKSANISDKGCRKHEYAISSYQLWAVGRKSWRKKECSHVSYLPVAHDVAWAILVLGSVTSVTVTLHLWRSMGGGERLIVVCTWT